MVYCNEMLEEYDDEGKDLDHQLNLILNTLKHKLPLSTYKFDMYEMIIKIMNKYEKLPEPRTYYDYLNYDTFLKETYCGVREKIKLTRQLIILLLANNYIKFDKVCIYNNIKMTFATIIMIMMLQVHEKNIYYYMKLCCMVRDSHITAELKLLVESDIHNTIELKLLVESGILSIINFNDISVKESYLREECMNEMRKFIIEYCYEYKNKLKNVLIITYDVINIIYLYLI